MTRRRRCITGGVVFGLLSATVIYFALAGHFGPFTRDVTEIDLASGRLRETRSVLGFRTSQVINDTAITKSAGPAGQPQWLTLLVVESPGASLHGESLKIRSAISLYDRVCDGFTVPADVRIHVAQTTVAAWHQPGGVVRAAEYLTRIVEAILAADHAGREITLAEIAQIVP